MRFSIIGGGIAGLTTAIALQRAGFDVVVFEAAPQFGEVGAGLGMGANAIKGFYALGMGDEVIAGGRILPVFTIYDEQGIPVSKANRPSFKKDTDVDNFMIHRATLQRILLSQVDVDKVLTNKRVIEFTQTDQDIKLVCQDGTIHHTDYVVAADGIHSVFRAKLVPGSVPRYAGYTCWRAVVENTNLDIEGSSETWGAKGRFGIGPLAGNQVYWFACINAARHDEGMGKFTIDDLMHHFKDYHEPIQAILAASKNEHLIWGDIVDLKPIRQFAFNNILLIGDAAHATTPNLGQGACQAVEDAVILADELKKTLDVREAFTQFEKRRIKRVTAIVNRSRFVGQMAQLENRGLVRMRNATMRILPQSFNDKQLKFLYEVDF